MPPIGHKHLTLIKHKKGENTYKLQSTLCAEKYIQTQYFTNFTE